MFNPLSDHAITLPRAKAAGATPSASTSPCPGSAPVHDATRPRFLAPLTVPDAHRHGWGRAHGALAAHAHAYRGPDRRAAISPTWRWLAATLDELDYGVILLSGDGRLMHVNHVAGLELDGDHPLQRQGADLRAQGTSDGAALHVAVQDAAQRGLRKLLVLGPAEHRVSMTVVPLPPAPDDVGAGSAVLLMLSKRHVCAELSVQGFARTQGLTPAETEVLKALCRGDQPATIAHRHGVAISTVRTQIGSIRAKTGAANIRALVRQVAVLPPMVGALRAGMGCAFAMG
jgi:DNA-binding CsgD family transcriptional regulator